MLVGTNSLGDVNALYNANGDLLVKYEYDAWGKVIAETDANGNALTGSAKTWSERNPFRYRGYYYDAETQLYYLQSRYYDAEVGRFVNSDAIVNTADSLGFNTFAYCFNNPNSYYDPTGFFPGVLIALGVLILGGLIWGASVDYKIWEQVDEKNVSTKLPQNSNFPVYNNAESINKLPISNNTLPQNYQFEPKKALPDDNIPLQNINENEVLTVGDRVLNAFIGASLGLALGGGIICVAGVVASVVIGPAAYIPLFGMTGLQTAAIGAFSLNIVTMVGAPALGISIEAIEFTK